MNSIIFRIILDKTILFTMKIKERKDRLKKKSLKKIKEGKVTKSKNLPKVLSDPAKDGKGPLDELKEILKCDHIVTFTYNKVRVMKSSILERR